MNRRTALITPLAAAAASVALAPRAHATISVTAYTHRVLQYGTLSLLTSYLARSNSPNILVQEFALGEIEEQIAVAQALTSSANPPPAILAPDQKQQLAMVQQASGSGFDSVYLDVQIAGHQKLRALQDEFIGPNPVYSDPNIHLALVARAFINNHLLLLQQLKKLGA